MNRCGKKWLWFILRDYPPAFALGESEGGGLRIADLWAVT